MNKRSSWIEDKYNGLIEKATSPERIDFILGQQLRMDGVKPGSVTYDLIKRKADERKNKLKSGAIKMISKRAKKKDTREQIIEFFKDTKKPSFRKLKKFIKDNNINRKETYNLTCDFAKRYVEFLTGGRSQGVPPKDMIPEEEAMGIEVEYEHTAMQGDAQKIAWDHLSEVKHYYTMLKHGEKILDEMGDKSKAPDVKLKKIKLKKVKAALDRLTKIANNLDTKGLYKEASEIDKVIKKINE